MINKYPLWKNLLILAVLIVGAVYALPNLYGEDQAIQISGSKGITLESEDYQKIEGVIANDCPDCVVERNEGQALIRFKDNDLRLRMKEKLVGELGDNYIVALNLAAATPEWLKAIGAKPLKLGLDLRGGLHFLMEVDMDEAIKKIVAQSIQDFRTELREEKIRLSGIRSIGQDIVITFRDEETRNKALRLLSGKHQDLTFTEGDSSSSFEIKAVMKPEKIKEVKTYAVEQNINIIRNRVNELGVAEPLVQRQGADRIIVELPGVEDSARAKEILGATATLEFRLVDQAADLQSAASGVVSSNDEVLTDRNGRPVVVTKHVILTGDHIIDAKSGMDENGRPEVNISLDSKGGNTMSNFTKDHIGQPMATNFIEYKVVDDQNGGDGAVKFRKVEQIINVATIQARLGNKFRITGLDSPTEAHNLALLLRAGALIAPIQIVEERNIGPSLGKQNIDNGMRAMMYGLIVLGLFMIVYYKAFGIIANLALIFNMVLLVGVMSMIPGATMTLPGIAGIVLTIGMAVDANVLIYERIREEIRNNRGVQQAINLGYERAFVTIMDSNITSILVALILFAVGTGAVKGFALVLMIGLVCSMFTAVTCCRAIVNLIWGGRDVKKLAI
ncbi:protein translocase subunit SecD [uncultured Ruminobacter sp.]|uniref:protein translocase subunit SecD n=1 Tax=uncultured Ruminobacter sp. TaxID=538947 RepID=UPI0025D8E7FF|nr:protein translocase subunit SecD [uncultured Ruminobacter sp.]